MILVRDFKDGLREINRFSFFDRLNAATSQIPVIAVQDLPVARSPQDTGFDAVGRCFRVTLVNRKSTLV